VPVGIDYGTTSSLAAVAPDRGRPRIVPVPQRPDGPVLDSLPAYFYFPSAGRVVVGEVARRLFTLKPHKVVRSVKRDLSRSWSIGRRSWNAGQLVTFALAELVRALEAELGSPPRGAVVTVPSTFGQRDRQIVVDAAREAGITGDVSLLDEPLAAFLAWLDEAEAGKTAAAPPEGRVLVFDMGGGTTDVSVLEIGRGGRGRTARVLGVWSDTRLGGDDFDHAVAGHLAGRWMAGLPSGLGPLTESERRWAGGKLLVAAEELKIALHGRRDEASVRVPDLPGATNLATLVDRATYEETVGVLLGRVLDTLAHGLERSGLAPGDVDRVMLAGGMSRLGLVRREVERFFGAPVTVLADPVTAVVRGACLHHSALVGREPGALVDPLRPVLTEGLDMRLSGGRWVTLLDGGTELPAARTLEGCLLTPHTGCGAIRLPLYTGDGPGGRRLLATMTLTSPVPLPGGQPVSIEVAADTNKLIDVRAHLADGGSAQRRLGVTGL